MSTFHICYRDAAISNSLINARMWYGNSAHVGDGRSQQRCIHNCDCDWTTAETDMV